MYIYVYIVHHTQKPLVFWQEAKAKTEEEDQKNIFIAQTSSKNLL